MRPILNTKYETKFEVLSFLETIQILDLKH